MAKPQPDDLILINRDRQSYKTKVGELLSDITKMPGPVGPQGPRGVQGSSGVEGKKGATGSTGPAPNHKWENNDDGQNTVLSFEQPNGGYVGSTPANLQGATGLTGPQGIQGIQGEQGDGLRVVGITIAGSNPDSGVSDPNAWPGHGNSIDDNITYPITIGDGYINNDPSVSASGGGVLWIAAQDILEGNNNSKDNWIVLDAVGVQGTTGATGLGATGATGVVGPQGATGPVGPVGPQGPEGDTGIQGVQGLTGPRGPQGASGATGPKGFTGDTGQTGPSNYEIWIEQGNTGSETEYLNTLKGATGASGPPGSAENLDLTAEYGVTVEGSGGTFKVKGVDAGRQGDGNAEPGVIFDCPNDSSKNYVRNTSGWTIMPESSAGLQGAKIPLAVNGNTVSLNIGKGLHVDDNDHLEAHLGEGLYFRDGKITAKQFESNSGTPEELITDYFYPSFLVWRRINNWDQDGRKKVYDGNKEPGREKLKVKLPKGSNGATITMIWRVQLSPSWSKNYGGGVGVASCQGDVGYEVNTSGINNFDVESSNDTNMGSLSFNHSIPHAMSGSGEHVARDWQQEQWVVRMDRWKYSPLGETKEVEIELFMSSQSSRYSHANHIIWNQGSRMTVLPYKSS